MDAKNTKRLNIMLWIAQALLSTSLIWAAFMKLFTAPADLAAMWPWTAESQPLVIATAFVDMLGGICIVGLSVVNARNQYTIYAAYGVIALMIAASVFHISRGEANLIGVNIFYMALAAFVAWGRKKVPPKE